MGKRIAKEDTGTFPYSRLPRRPAFTKSEPNLNLIPVYLANEGKAAGLKESKKDCPAEIKRIVDSVTSLFREYHPSLMLNSHCGNGSFIFGYLGAVIQIPKLIPRIAFIDSDYGYEYSLHTRKLANWL